MPIFLLSWILSMRQSERSLKKKTTTVRETCRLCVRKKKVQWNTHRAEMQHFMLDFRIKVPPLSWSGATAVYKMTPAKVHSKHGPRPPGGRVNG